MISIQTEDFSLNTESELLTSNNEQDGALVTFVGRVRDKNLNRNVTALHLEHYPEMTEKSLANIITQARNRWPISRVKVIHRIGTLQVGEQIVFVGVTSAHRQAAFAACEFIMDYLKVEAPFWKKEITTEGAHWLEARTSDQQKASDWEK